MFYPKPDNQPNKQMISNPFLYMIQWEFQLCSWFVQDTWIPLMPVIFNFIFKCYLFEGYCRHPYLQTT